MKQNDDGKTVRAMDVLFPGIGEIIGGSQREEDYDKLAYPDQRTETYRKKISGGILKQENSEQHLTADSDLALKDLILFVTGMSNIRDVIPFPRTPKNAEF